jgi:hypothetical protein
MLEEVGESGSARPFIGGTDVIPEVHRYNWSGMILGQCDKKPVIKMKGFYGNSHCRKLPAMQSDWNPLYRPT